MRIYSRIIGTGSYLPENRLSNADLAGVDLLSSQSLSQIKLACSEGGLGGLEDRL